MAWKSQEDVDFDFVAVSDFYNTEAVRRFSPNIQERKARSKPSMYDEEEITNNGVYVPRGRGALSALDRNFTLSVGSVLSHNAIKKDISEVSTIKFDSALIVEGLEQNVPEVTNSTLNGMVNGVVSAEQKPPPLYDIVTANSSRKKISKPPTLPKKDEEDVKQMNIFQAMPDKQFDLNSKRDFPDLH